MIHSQFYFFWNKKTKFKQSYKSVFDVVMSCVSYSLDNFKSDFI